jgi:hypothetical protein
MVVTHLTVQVIFPFTPFCTSQVLLVNPIGDPNALKLLPRFILKVYGRFYPYRPKGANKPWSYAVETEATAKRLVGAVPNSTSTALPREMML